MKKIELLQIIRTLSKNTKKLHACVENSSHMKKNELIDAITMCHHKLEQN